MYTIYVILQIDTKKKLVIAEDVYETSDEAEAYTATAPEPQEGFERHTVPLDLDDVENMLRKGELYRLAMLIVIKTMMSIVLPTSEKDDYSAAFNAAKSSIINNN